MKRRGCDGRPPISPRRKRKWFGRRTPRRFTGWLTRHGRPRVIHLHKRIGDLCITGDALDALNETAERYENAQALERFEMALERFEKALEYFGSYSGRLPMPSTEIIDMAEARRRWPRQ